MRLSIIGTGYVGLITGVCLAELGVTVTCVDIDAKKVETINSGIAPIYEPGLEQLLRNNLKNERFSATTDIKNAVLNTDISIIAVGTPFEDNQTNLQYIISASEAIGFALRGKTNYHTIVVKSTVPPGTTDDVVLPTVTRSSGKIAGPDFGVGMNPEFLREGCAVDDFLHPDRIVIGGIDDTTIVQIRSLYSVFEDVPLIETSNRTAELIKYTSNSLLATLISFSNEIGNICAKTPGVDIVDVMAGVHLDKRFNPVDHKNRRVNPPFLSYLKAGCGFGGSCFPKDVKALVTYSKTIDVPAGLLESVIAVNEAQPHKVVEIIKAYFGDLQKRRVAVLGLAFKPETDDVRESPALPVILELIELDATVIAHDPIATSNLQHLIQSDQLTYSDSLFEAIRSVDAVVLLTHWKEYDEIPDIVEQNNLSFLFVDGRRNFEKGQFHDYRGIGLDSNDIKG